MTGHRIDGAGVRRPGIVLGMRQHRRASGEPYLVAVVDEDLYLPAGCELHLRRLRPDGDGDTPTHALVVVPPEVAMSNRQRDRAAADRLDGSVLRRDPRDGGGA